MRPVLARFVAAGLLGFVVMLAVAFAMLAN